MKNPFRRGVPPRNRNLEIIADSPLNDPARVAVALGGRQASLAAFDEKYFSLPEDARPSLTPFFDTAFYRDANPDVAQARMDPYLHFLLHGVPEGRAPHPLIDLSFIASQMGQAGDASGLDPQRLAEVLRHNKLSPHPLFDVGYYLDQYPDVRQSGTSALQHFIDHGAEEGRTPNSAFDADAYPRAHADAGNRYGAFLDFVRAGGQVRQGRAATPAPAGGIQGVLDTVAGGTASGWAWDPGHPEHRLVVEVVEGDRVVARGPADRLREDLRRSGIGDGQYHFKLKISTDLLDGKPHALNARVADEQSAMLHGMHELASRPKSDPAFDAIPATETMALARRLASGWTPALAEAFVRDFMDCNLLLETAQPLEAAIALQQMAGRYPAIGLNDLKMGEAQLHIGDIQAAMNAYERVDGEGPLAAWGLLGKGNIQRLLGHWDQAEAIYLQTVSVAPDMPQARDRLQQVQYRKSRVEAARLVDLGETRGALKLLVPELLARPEDVGICDLVATMVDPPAEKGQAGGPVQTDPVVAAARRSWQLLEVIADCVELGVEGHR